MTFPVHPFLLALYPIMALLASNIDQVEGAAAWRPSLLSLAAALVLLVVLRWLTRSWHRGAGLTSLALVAFFTYGHVYDVLKNVEWMGGLVGRHRYLLPGLSALLLFLSWKILGVRDGAAMTQLLNTCAVVLLALPLLQIGAHRIRTSSAAPATRLQVDDLGGTRPAQPPDIYYILLDAYTRQDVLRTDFGVDNGPFLARLGALGFYVADCSQSNYAQTELSLSTTLNMEYLDQLGQFSPDGHDRTPLLLLIQQSVVRQALEQMGYQVIAFETGYPFIEWKDADVYLRPGRGSGFGIDLPLTGYEALLLDSTALRILTDARAVLPPALGGALQGPVELHRRRVLFTLEQLEQMAERPGPKFVYAHIVAPHRPYVFAPDAAAPSVQRALLPEFQAGEAGGYVVGYRNQVLYLNDRLLSILEVIIQDSEVPPIIILQGDHGADEAPPVERMAILNAVRLPGIDRATVTESRSPVNTFRIVLAETFGMDLPLLEEASYYSSYEAPFDFIEIPVGCKPG